MPYLSLLDSSYDWHDLLDTPVHSCIAYQDGRSGKPGPNKGGLNPYAPLFYPQGFEPGVRVANPSSCIGRSVAPTTVEEKACAKGSEVWAMFGYGHVEHRSRIRRIKRSFRRACKRALIAGQTTYRGKYFMASDAPCRLRGQLKIEIHRLSLSPPSRTRQQDGSMLKIFSWNASRNLNYHEWLAWCGNRSKDVLMIQESNWTRNYQWETDQWYCICSQESAASLRKSLLRSSLLAYAVLIPSRLLHIRLMLDRIHDLYTTYQAAWNTSKPVRLLL